MTKAPIPFINKVPSRSSAQDAAETERNRNWDPNSALAGRNPAPGSASGARRATATGDVGRPTLIAADGRSIRLCRRSPSARPRPARAAASARRRRRASHARRRRPAADGGRQRPFIYFVQAGAYSRTEDAEQQRAKLAMLGMESRLTEREQGGRMVYRVRVGPFDRREDAEAAKEKLGGSGVDAALVAVQK